MTASEVESETEFEGGELVEIADSIVAASAGARPPGALLHEMSAQTGLLLALTLPAIVRSGAPPAASAPASPPTPTEIYDTFAYPAPGRLREQFGRCFEVLALPSTVLDRDLAEGDILVRRGDGNMAHFAVIVSSELRDLEVLALAGLTPETYRPGYYVQVVETGARPHTRNDGFARRVTDLDGVVPRDTLLLRWRASSTQSTDAAPATPSFPIQESADGRGATIETTTPQDALEIQLASGEDTPRGDAAPPYDTAAAVAYARKFWNRPCSDLRIAPDLNHHPELHSEASSTPAAWKNS